MFTTISKIAANTKSEVYRNSGVTFNNKRKRSIQKNYHSENHFELRSIPVENKVVQPKLKVNKPNDKYEQEADRIAEQVLRMPSGNNSNQISAEADSIQRKCAKCEEEEQLQMKAIEPTSENYIQRQEEEEEELQMKEKSGVSQRPGISSSMLSSGSGSPMSDGLRSFFEPRFGADFSGVKIHSDKQSAEVSDSIGARAFTYGSDIYFNRDEYNPASTEGKRLLSHELTHVLQQNGSEPDIQRSCSDGKCDECAGGEKTLWATIFFGRKADKKTMGNLRKDISNAKSILKNCCVDIKFNFDWTLIPGAEKIDSASAHRRPSGDAKGIFDVPEPLESIGEGKLISKAKGIPMVVVEEVKGTGGATTILSGKDDNGKEFDLEYTGKDMVFLAPNQSGYFSGCSAIAHELWHIAGPLRHDASEGGITACTNNNVSEKYCNAIRGLAT